MMRRLFIVSTLLFWLAFVGFGVAPRWLASPDPTETEAATAAPAAVGRTWTLAELARHDRAEDCWMAIDGDVYDLTAYLPDHPSDPAVILPWCGREATEAYRTKTRGRRHSAYADGLLSGHRIGVFDATQP